MSMTATVDHARRRVLVRAEGSITLDEILAHLDEERGLGGLSYSELIDGRGHSPDFSAAQVRVIVAALRRHAESSVLGPTAIIVETDVGYGMLRMLEMLVEDVCAVRPFRREAEAEKWLGEFSGDAT